MLFRSQMQTIPDASRGVYMCSNHEESEAVALLKVDEDSEIGVPICEQCVRNVAGHRQLARTGEIDSDMPCDLCSSKAGVIAFKLPDETNKITGWACTACRLKIYNDLYPDT